jgi:hypothetical protein
LFLTSFVRSGEEPFDMERFGIVEGSVVHVTLLDRQQQVKKGRKQNRKGRGDRGLVQRGARGGGRERAPRCRH